MGSSKAVKPYSLFEGIQLDQDRTSIEMDVSRYDSCSIKIDWDNTLTPVGEIKVEVKNSDDQNEEWFELNFGQLLDVPVVAPDETDKMMIQITELDFKYLRLFYDRTSGDGTMNAVLLGKSEGV